MTSMSRMGTSDPRPVLFQPCQGLFLTSQRVDQSLGKRLAPGIDPPIGETPDFLPRHAAADGHHVDEELEHVINEGLACLANVWRQFFKRRGGCFQWRAFDCRGFNAELFKQCRNFGGLKNDSDRTRDRSFAG